MVINLSLKFPKWKRPELVEEALLTITEVMTNKAQNIREDNITNYLTAVARKRMATFYKRDKLVGPKNDTYCEYEFYPLGDNLPDRSAGHTVELRDTIHSCCRNDLQIKIADLIEEGGWTIQEIADELSISSSYAGKLKTELESLLWQKLFMDESNEENSKGVCERSECPRRRHLC